MEIKVAYERLYKIRRFEEILLNLFSENKLKGTTHTSIGQEAVAVATMANVTAKDFVFSNHRCHGHFLAYSDNAQILFAEIMGKKTGVCRGRGGSQHICYKNFYTNGVQGGIVPNATGIALAEKLKGSDGIAIVFIGDGTLGQGIVYESFNMASLYHIPILYIVEDNGYAMTTKRTDAMAGSIKKRLEAFDIDTAELETNDVEILEQAIAEACTNVREKKRPFCQIIHTYRLAPHSKGDDFRAPLEIEEWREKDPLKIVEARLSSKEKEAVRKKVEKELADALDNAEREGIDLDKDVYKEYFGHYTEEKSFLNEEKIKCVESLNKGLKQALEDMEAVALIGEDIKDPYGGAFRVTKGLSSQFGDRIINTPISEAGFIGMSVGLALNGIKPVTEMMFGDFITLGFDQILNHATKYRWMYAEQVSVPMLIRIPMGGGRGYGATHSQSLEKYFTGIPNLRMIAVSRLVDPGKLIYHILKEIDSPVLLIENKKMYSEKLYVRDEAGKLDIFQIFENKAEFPIYRLTIDGKMTADAAIVTYGVMTDLAMEASKTLMLEDEIMVDIIVCTSLTPLYIDKVCGELGDVKNIITLEEGTIRSGWGAEVIASLTESLSERNYRRVGALNCVIPSGSELENGVLPEKSDIVKLVRRMINE